MEKSLLSVPGLPPLPRSPPPCLCAQPARGQQAATRPQNPPNLPLNRCFLCTDHLSPAAMLPQPCYLRGRTQTHPFLSCCSFIYCSGRFWGFFKCSESFKLLWEEHQPKRFQQHLGLAELATILKLIRNSFGGFTHMLSLVAARFILVKTAIYHYFYNKKWFSLCPRVNRARIWRDPFCHAKKMQNSPFSLPART